ncbi:response regulator transcription factor [Vallitalea okinawensis]|uniref:response regulator transcription factor n=1 Tax=Vallitalea okinawensis TaxID=2078660 RepID=UPI002E8DE1A9|nr:response regulator transcription factor [Vallitalea okinawensis]
MKRGVSIKNIYLVEDEEHLSSLLTTYLEDEGYKVKTFSDGLKAYKEINNDVDLWILDIMVSGMNGYTLIKEIKKLNKEIPVIFMSARNAELDRVIGLEMGSDDYLPKPFLPRELVLRVNRLLNNANSKIVDSTELIGDYLFRRQTRDLSIDDENIVLTNKEYDLLNYFIQNLEVAVKRDEIIDNVWGLDYFGSSRVVDDTIRRIRKKAPYLPIENVYGYGYILKRELSYEK